MQIETESIKANRAGLQVQNGKSLKELKALSMHKEAKLNKSTGHQPLSFFDLNLTYECSKPISLIDMPLLMTGGDELDSIGEEKAEVCEEQIENEIEAHDYVEEETFHKGKKGKGNKKAKKKYGDNTIDKYGNSSNPLASGKKKKKK
ncbi:unnamed protein product [Cuscuta campestris]|uniref:Uncharacterized protein n=1 Tax=Cuscuta campestris TaxID=132261 RepID=A0A484KT67_9ASTE|nr:unnamed protein product [Cuscuta campestris]